MAHGDYWVDGHYIAAPDVDSARAEVRRIYGHNPDVVRQWTTADQRELERIQAKGEEA